MSELDPLDSSPQDKAREQSRAKDKQTAQSEADDIKWLMSSRRGRRILWKQLERAGVFRLSFNTNSMTMAFAEGARNEGLRLITLIHRHCADLYPTMVKESNEVT